MEIYKHQYLCQFGTCATVKSMTPEELKEEMASEKSEEKEDSSFLYCLGLEMPLMESEPEENEKKNKEQKGTEKRNRSTHDEQLDQMPERAYVFRQEVRDGMPLLQL